VAYLDIDAFKSRTIMPSAHVDEVETVQPGFWAHQLETWSRKIDARLRKRYAVPFAAEAVPETVKGWLTQIVTMRGYLRRGIDPSDAQFEMLKQDYDDAMAELAEAADADKGLFDLPLIDTADASAISKPATRAYSEQSPYAGFDRQSRIGREEDSNGEGTFT
jgi:hypothetical protein